MSEQHPTSAGADWAMWDPEVAKKWGDNWVVAVPGTIVEAGKDVEQVRAAAAVKLGMPPSEIIVCAVATLESRCWM